MSRTRTLTLVLAASTLAASGCGSSQSSGSSLSKAELIARADSICRRVNTMRRTVVVGVGNFQNGYATLLPPLVAYERSALVEFEKLTPPASLAADWKLIVENFRILVDDNAKTAEYGKKGNFKGLEELNTPNNRATGQIVVLARNDGFGDCTRI